MARCDSLHPTLVGTNSGKDDQGRSVVTREPVRCWHGAGHNGRHGYMSHTWAHAINDNPVPRETWRMRGVDCETTLDEIAGVQERLSAALRDLEEARNALDAIDEYEIDWTKGTAANVVAVQEIAVAALDRLSRHPTPGDGKP